MKKSSTFKHRLEFGMFYLIYLSVNILPYRFSHFFAWVISRIAFTIFKIRRKETVARIKEHLGADTSEAESIAYASYFNIAATALEFVRFNRFGRLFSKGYISIDGIEKLEELRGKGKGVVLAGMHSGNWEISGAALRSLGFNLFYVVGIQHNPYIDRLINRMRTTVGIDVIPKKGALKEVFRRLKKGEILGIIADQHVAGDTLELPFLGEPVHAPKGPAAFAHKSGVPLIPYVALRENTCNHRVLVYDPIYPDVHADREEEIQRITEEYHAVFESVIREHPGDWFWLHRRWRKKCKGQGGKGKELPETENRQG